MNIIYIFTLIIIQLSISIFNTLLIYFCNTDTLNYIIEKMDNIEINNKYYSDTYYSQEVLNSKNNYIRELDM
jgi:hypothetical protein